jgi:hypothetical protein
MKGVTQDVAAEVAKMMAGTALMLALIGAAIVAYFGGFAVGVALVQFGAPASVGVFVGGVWAFGAHLALIRARLI